MDNLAEWDEAAQKSATITTEELDQWAAKYKELEDEYESKKEIASEAYERLSVMEGKLAEAMDQAGKTKYHIPGIGEVQRTSRKSVQTPKSIEDKQAFAKELERRGGKVMFWNTFGVNSQTLQSFYKNAFAEHEKLCEESGEPTDFSIPGLGAPTATASIKLDRKRA